MTSTSPKKILEDLNTESFFGGRNILFIHNWRCAGTSLHSLLKANLRKRYLKIGDPFNRFGKGKYNPALAEASTTLRYLRSHSLQGTVIAGHIFMGLESFLPGVWDCWMNAREPVSRMRSGLLRFHTRDTTGGTAKTYDLIKPSPGLVDRDSLSELLSTSLKRERNGICRRLAAMTLTNEFSLTETENIERNPLLEKPYSDQDLFNTARDNLQRVKLLFLADHFSASVISLERTYKLPPLINPFTTLRHNSSRVSGYTSTHEECLHSNHDLILESQSADAQLWPLLLNRFQTQVEDQQISKQEIATRELIHREPLFNIDWFTQRRDSDEVVELMAKAIVSRSRVKPSLGPALIDTVLSSPLFSYSARERLASAIQRLVPTQVMPV